MCPVDHTKRLNTLCSKAGILYVLAFGIRGYHRAFKQLRSWNSLRLHIIQTVFIRTNWTNTKFSQVWMMSHFVSDNTGRFVIFSAITNIYNKKTKVPTLMESFKATGKLKKFFLQLEMFDVCTTGDTAHIDMIFKFLPHTRQHGYIEAKRHRSLQEWRISMHLCSRVCGKNVNIVVHTSNISSCQKNSVFLWL
jgi:hypothetical protein